MLISTNVLVHSKSWTLSSSVSVSASQMARACAGSTSKKRGIVRNSKCRARTRILTLKVSSGLRAKTLRRMFEWVANLPIPSCYHKQQVLPILSSVSEIGIKRRSGTTTLQGYHHSARGEEGRRVGLVRWGGRAAIYLRSSIHSLTLEHSLYAFTSGTSPSPHSSSIKPTNEIDRTNKKRRIHHPLLSSVHGVSECSFLCIVIK